jgi:hypothetical protein
MFSSLLSSAIDPHQSVKTKTFVAGPLALQFPPRFCDMTVYLLHAGMQGVYAGERAAVGIIIVKRRE